MSDTERQCQFPRRAMSFLSSAHVTALAEQKHMRNLSRGGCAVGKSGSAQLSPKMMPRTG